MGRLSLSRGVLVLVAMPFILMTAACAEQMAPVVEEQKQLTQTLQDLSTSVQQLQGQVSHLHEATHQLEGQLSEVEAFSGRLILDGSRVGIGRASFLPDPPEGMVTVQLLAQPENASIPGTFTFHLAPEGAELFATESLPKGESPTVGPEIEEGIAFVEPGKFYRLQVVYRNPTDEEIKFLVRGGIIDPQIALPFVRNLCWCAAIPFSVPAGGTFSRIIEVGVGPDTPAGAKAIVIFPVVRLTS